jgi:hypothetical protein
VKLRLEIGDDGGLGDVEVCAVLGFGLAVERAVKRLGTVVNQTAGEILLKYSK